MMKIAPLKPHFESAQPFTKAIIGYFGEKRAKGVLVFVHIDNGIDLSPECQKTKRNLYSHSVWCLKRL